MESINSRIAQCIVATGLTKTAFAKKINLSQPHISKIALGDSVPSDRTIADICREFAVNETWLRTGEGEMFIPALTNELDALASRYPNMTHETYVLVEKLVSLPRASQDIITGFMREVVEGFGDEAPALQRTEKPDSAAPISGDKRKVIREKVADLYEAQNQTEEKPDVSILSANESAAG